MTFHDSSHINYFIEKQKPSAKAKRKSQAQKPSANAKRKNETQKPSTKSKRKSQAQKPKQAQQAVLKWS